MQIVGLYFCLLFSLVSISFDTWFNTRKGIHMYNFLLQKMISIFLENDLRYPA